MGQRAGIKLQGLTSKGLVPAGGEVVATTPKSPLRAPGGRAARGGDHTRVTPPSKTMRARFSASVGMGTSDAEPQELRNGGNPEVASLRKVKFNTSL